MAFRQGLRLLIDEVGSDGVGSNEAVNFEGATAAFQLEMTAEGVVVIEGRAGPAASWLPLTEEMSGNQTGTVTLLLPRMRARFTGNTGTINFWLIS